MTFTSSDIPLFPIRHAVMVLSLSTLVPMVVIAIILAMRGDFAMLTESVLVGFCCLAAALGALEPVRLASLKAKTADKVTLAALVAIVVRLGLTILFVVLVVRLARLEVSSAGLWAMGWYVLMLIVEVRLFQQYFKTLTPPTTHPRDETQTQTPTQTQPSKMKTESDTDLSQTDRETKPC